METKEKELNETDSGVPANAMGASSSTSGPIQTFDPLLTKRRLKRFSNLVKRKPEDVRSQ